MKNRLIDLNDHLFSLIEALNDEDLTDAELDEQIKRARVINVTAQNIIHNAGLALEAAKFKESVGDSDLMPKMLEDKQLIPKK